MRTRLLLAVAIAAASLVQRSEAQVHGRPTHPRQAPAPLTTLECRKDAGQGSLVMPERFTVAFSQGSMEVDGQRVAKGSFSVSSSLLSAKVAARGAVGVFHLEIRRSDGAYRMLREGTTMVEDVGRCAKVTRSF